MSRPSDEALSRAFAAMRETDRKRAPAFQELLAGTGWKGANTEGDGSPPTQADLLQLSPEAVREHLSKDPRLQYRSFAEPMLNAFVEKSRAVVFDDPATARAWAALVPALLDLTASEGEEIPWHRHVRVKAAAFEANALRVSGDFRSAGQIFDQVNREMKKIPDVGRDLRAQMASLEASLYTDSGQFKKAGRKISQALELYRKIGDSTGYTRCLIQKANVAGAQFIPEEAVGPLEEAAALLDPIQQSDLYLGTIVGRINALCNSGRPREAEKVLQAHWREFTQGNSPYLQALGQCLRGRVFLGKARSAEAESAFRLALNQFLSIGRNYDAAINCLFLAETYLALGDTAKLRKMATDAFEVFRSRGVARDMLAALRLLSEAAKADEVTLSLVSRLRRDLESSA